MDIPTGKPTRRAPEENFTGDVWVDDLVRGQEPSRVRMGLVHFSPAARSAWHCHALGQALYVTDGEGRVQSRGGEIVTLRSGDVAVTPAGEWHWHGAAPDRFFSHLSITEEDTASDGPKTSWGSKVTDAEYLGEG